MIQDYALMAAKNLRKRKLRSWLTMIGIFISIATIFVLISVSVGLQSAIQEQFRLLGADKFFVMPKGQAAGPGTPSAVSLTTADVAEIEKVAGVKDISYANIASAEVKDGNQKRYFSVAGIPLDHMTVFEEINSYKADEGRMLKEGDEGFIMVGSQYKYNNVFDKPIKVGDTLEINGVPLKVRAVLQPIGNSQDDRMVYLTLEDFKKIFKSGDRVDQIMVQVNGGADIKDVSARVEKKLTTFRGVTAKTRDFTITTPEELLASFDTILNIITGFLVGVAAISLLVGGIGIANTMYTSVLERTKEIGTMKAVGAQNKDILLIFLIESGILGMVGGIIGVILGIAISKSIEYIAVYQLGTNLLKAAIPTYLVVGCLLFAFLAGAISGTWPAWQATKIKPVDALRYE